MKIIILLLAALCLAGCKRDYDSHVIALEQRLAKLESQTQIAQTNFALLAQENVYVMTNSFTIGQRLTLLESARKNANFVSINPDNPAFGICETPNGKLYVSTKGITPYLDGYKVTLDVGNPQSATFKNLEIHAHWDVTIITNSQGQLEWLWQHETTNTITTSLQAGYWTPVEINLLPCNAADLRQAELEVFSSEVLLLKTPSSNPR